MATADTVKGKLQNLIAKANTATGNGDADLTAAINTLIGGYGKGTILSESLETAVRTVTLTTTLGNGTNSNYVILSGDEFVKEHYNNDNFCVILVPEEQFAGASGYNVHGILQCNRNIGSLETKRYGIAYCSTSSSSLSAQQISARLDGNGLNASIRARATGDLSVYISSARKLNAGTYKIIMACPSETTKPSDLYQQVEYITSDSNTYIATDFIADNDCGVETIASFPNFADHSYMGSRMDSGNTRFYASYPLSATSSYFGFNGATKITTSTLTIDTVYRFQTNFLNSRLANVYDEEGNQKGSTAINATLTDHTIPIDIFCYNNAGNHSVPRVLSLYRARCSRGHEVVREYIPCYRKSDGVIGLYEKYTGQFLTNAAESGAFTKGADVEWGTSFEPDTDEPDSGIDTSDATATAGDILSGKTAYVNGEKITGTIATKTSSSLSTSGASVIVPAGYYATQASKSVTTASKRTPTISVSTAGTITASVSYPTGYVTAGTVTANKQLDTQTAQTIIPGTADQTIEAGKYLTGVQTIKGDANLVPENIVSGKSIFGVEGAGGSSGSGGSADDLTVRLIERDISLTEISNNAVTKIGVGAFSKYYHLESVSFPNVTVIEDYAFFECYELKSVNCPNVTYISTSAFNDCDKLANVDFPVLEFMYEDSFDNCNSLRTFIIRNQASVAVMFDDCFSNTPIRNGTGYIYVPSVLIDEYKVAENWSDYEAQFRALEDYTIDGTVDGELDPEKTNDDESLPIYILDMTEGIINDSGLTIFATAETTWYEWIMGGQH